MLLALADLRFVRSRFLLVGVMIALVALLATLLSGLANGLVDDGISGLRRLPATHLAFQPGAESTFSRSTLTAANLEPWSDADGVEESPLGVSFLNAKRSSGPTVDLALFGVPADSFLAPTGGAGAALSEAPGLVLDVSFREEGIAVGDELTIVGVDRTLPVLGFTDAGSYGHVNIAFTSLGTWQQLLYGESASGRFSAIAIRAVDGVDLRRIASAADTQVETTARAYRGSPGYSGETQTMTLIRGFLLVISALIVGSFFAIWSIQRANQIGLLKALGASNGYVVRDALAQMALVLGGAIVAGAVAAVGVGRFIGGDVPFRLEAGGVITTAVALQLLGMLGCVIAVRRLTSVAPIVALRAGV